MSEKTAIMEPPAKKQRIEDHVSQVPQSVVPVDDFSKDVEVDGEDRGFSVNEDKYTNYVTQEELERLREFHVLDEVKSNDEDSNEEDSESSDGKSEGLPEEEIEKMLEEDLPEDFKGVPKPKEKPYITRQKVVLEEKGVNHFEVLPLDWMVARHYSGMPIYMHRATRVCTLSKPYFLGKGNTRRHDIPISAIPCLAYRKALVEERKQKEIDKQIEEQIKSGTWKNNIGKENSDNNSENNANKDLGYKHKNNINQSSKKTDDSVFKCPVSGNTADEKLAKESIDVNSKCPFKRGFLTKDSETSKNSKEKDEETSKSISKNDSSVDSQDIPKIAQDITYLDEGLEKVNENAIPMGIVANEDATTELVNTEKTFGNLNADSMNEEDTTDKMNSTPDNAFTQKADVSRLNEANVGVSSNIQLTIDETINIGQVISNTDIPATEEANKTSNTKENKAHDPSNSEIGTKLPPAYKGSRNTEASKETPQDNNAKANKETPLASNTETTNETAQADNTHAYKEVPLNMQPVVLPGGIVMPPPRVETVSTSWKTQHLTPEEVNEYCKSLFKFKTVNIMHFKRWADRRKYTKARKTLQYPTLPEGTKLITIPAQPSNGQENGGKATKRDWVMNMNGRSYLSVFHEYVRRALQKQPVYEFRQLENASTPYQATVYIGGMQYGVGRGSSKRAAKSAAARASIHILIPEMRRELDDAPEGAEPEPDFSFFDYVGIEDPRITEFCAATCEPSPHAILRTCLLRNFGAGDRHIHTEMKKLEYQKIELTMKVGKHSATVVCKNKKTAKQRASQAILQALHPHVRSWGSLLRLYGSRSVKSCKEKKLEEQQITLLQDAAKHNEPNYAVLEKLRNEMRKLRERDEAVVPIGTLLVKDDLPTHSGSNLNNVDL